MKQAVARHRARIQVPAASRTPLGSSGGSIRASLALVLFGMMAAGCGGAVHVERVVPSSAVDSYRVGTVHEVSVVRPASGETPLGDGARIRNGRVESGGTIQPISVPLGDDDVIEVDARDRIAGVRRKDGSVVRFEPGTASSPEGADFVTGMPLGSSKPKAATVLGVSDRVRMSGELSSGDVLPDGTRVTSTRFTFGLVGGGILWSLAYLPTFVAGVTSDRSYDRSLMIPVFGPWINLAKRTGCGTRPTEGDEAVIRAYAECEVTERVAKVVVPLSGVVQGVGAVLFLIGLPQSLKLEEPEKGARAKLRLVPMPFDGPSAAVVGTF